MSKIMPAIISRAGGRVGGRVGVRESSFMSLSIAVI